MPLGGVTQSDRERETTLVLLAKQLPIWANPPCEVFGLMWGRASKKNGPNLGSGQTVQVKIESLWSLTDCHR
jgi:hypothetical protein